MTWKKLSG